MNPETLSEIRLDWLPKDTVPSDRTVRAHAVPCPQVEGVEFDETFAPVARMESIRLFFAVACHLNIKLHQMNVKSAFLNGDLNEEVYIEQPKGFVDPHHPK